MHYWIIGTLNIITLSILGYKLKVHFPGLIGFESSSQINLTSTKVIILELIITLIFTSIIIWLALIILKVQNIRLVDIASFYLIPKIPCTFLLLISIMVYFLIPDLATINLQEGSPIKFKLLNFILSFISYPFFIWELILSFNAFKELSDFKGYKLWFGVITTFIIINCTLYVSNNFLVKLIPFRSI